MIDRRMLDDRDVLRLLFGFESGSLSAESAARSPGIDTEEFLDLRHMQLMSFPPEKYLRVDAGREPDGPHRVPAGIR